MNRDKILEKYKWNIDLIYSSKDDFFKDIDFVKEKINCFSKYENIDFDSDSLYELLTLYFDIERIINKLGVYAELLCDEDTSINKNQELKESVSNLSDLFISKTYFIDNKILSIDYDVLMKYCKSNSKLNEYKRYLDKLYRYKNHKLSDECEKLLANMSKAFGNTYDSYELLKDSDMDFDSFSVDGFEYELDNSKYGLYIESDNREIRKNAFNGLYKKYKQFKNIFSSLISSNVKEEVTMARIRNYNSALDNSLFYDELDSSIYNNLINTVNKNIGVLHDYYRMKKDVLGLDELHLYDVYANLVTSDDFNFEFENAKDMVINALHIFGDEYVNILKDGINDRWIDVYPNKGKRTGGYSSGSYDTNPYILLNYQNKYDDMSTLAHELGHSMHSYFTRHNNPYQYGHYSIFVAEVASTVNELVLAKYVLNNTDDCKLKLFVLNRMMELFRATIFRQTMFAEFEKELYDLVENDKPVTADILSDLYYKLNKTYFGDDVYIDEDIKYEWERIPHFYYNFYVYKYATGLSAACYIVNGLYDGSINKDDYINFLKCGDSKTPIESLKVAGVDLNDPKVIESAISMFDSTMKEFISLYNSSNK